MRLSHDIRRLRKKSTVRRNAPGRQPACTTGTANQSDMRVSLNEVRAPGTCRVNNVTWWMRVSVGVEKCIGPAGRENAGRNAAPEMARRDNARS